MLTITRTHCKLVLILIDRLCLISGNSENIVEIYLERLIMCENTQDIDESKRVDIFNHITKVYVYKRIHAHICNV